MVLMHSSQMNCWMVLILQGMYRTHTDITDELLEGRRKKDRESGGREGPGGGGLDRGRGREGERKSEKGRCDGSTL
jgi:hypothetical protein